MSLDTYAHLSEDRLDQVGDALDRASTAARLRRDDAEALPRVARVLPEPDSQESDEGAPPSVSAGSEPLFRSVPPTGFEPALPP